MFRRRRSSWCCCVPGSGLRHMLLIWLVMLKSAYFWLWNSVLRSATCVREFLSSSASRLGTNGSSSSKMGGGAGSGLMVVCVEGGRDRYVLGLKGFHCFLGL